MDRKAPHSQVSGRPRKSVASRRKPEWLLFIIVLVASVYILPRWGDWNVNSRMDLVYAIVDRGTLAIDDYYTNTGDYAYFEGHFYSDKAPATSFLALPVYALYAHLGARQLTDAMVNRLAHNQAFAATLDPDGKGLIAESAYRYGALILASLLLVAVPCAVLAVVLFRLALDWTASPFIAFLTAAAYSLGTPAFAYANNLYGHQIAAFLLVGSFYLLYQAGKGVHATAYALVAGLALGGVVVVEYQTGLIAGAIGLYAIHRMRNLKLIGSMIIAGAPPILLAAAYNWSIFHTPLPVGYLYSPLYTDLHHIGLISLTYPKIDALLELMFGVRRGLFLISPYLLLCVPGFLYFARLANRRAEFAVCAWSVLSFWLFNSSSAMWQGGFAIGPRYLLPMLPFMALPVAYALQHARSIWARIGVGILLLASIAGVWILTLGGQQFPQYQVNPWFEYSIPALMRSDIARNFGMFINLRGYASLLPLIVFLAAILTVFLWQLRSDLRHPQAIAHTQSIP